MLYSNIMTDMHPFITTIQERGFLRDCTNLTELNTLLESGPQRAYVGFDCTADSLHVGSLTLITLMRWFQKTGHTPIILIGSSTSKIGDPSGKNQSRPILSLQDIDANKRGIVSVFTKFLGIPNNDFIIVDNAEWLDNLKIIPFLRDVGRHFSVNQMLTMDTVKSRLEAEESFSFLEFNYSLFQAFDFVMLNRLHGCKIQFGGSDQFGNICQGIELGRKMDKAEFFGLTTPLITNSDGSKMGKTSSGNTCWLDAKKTLPFDFWQFWRNVSDEDVKKFLLLFTELPVKEIEALTAEGGQALNIAKKILAAEVTTLCHGEEIAEQCLEAATELFEKGGISDNLPTIFVTTAQLTTGIPIIELFKIAGLAETNSDVRRLIAGRGARMNDQIITDPKMILTELVDPVKLSSGKKNHILVKVKE
jgi:tyrosyl-tRNA synthetase